MKIKTRREVPMANKIFTDRVEPRTCFWNKYSEFKNIMNDGNVSVLTYYGIGGIGKSTLLKKLMSEMSEKLEQPLYVYFDFNIKQDSRTVLESIKNILSEKYKMNFPMFDLALFNYAKKIGEDANTPEETSFVGKSPLLSFLTSVLNEIPVVNVASSIIGVADKGAVFVKSLIENHKRDLILLDGKTPAEIYSSLPYYFSLDLTDNMQNAKEPLVIFLDTYEKLVNEMTAVGEPLNNDEWLRSADGLIQNIPNVFWVIAGREKLKWEQFDSDWSDALDQHILGSLSRYDASHFLETAGISDESLRNSLYELTDGTPVYLDLCVDRYMSLVENGQTPVISDFGQNIYTLIERFMRYMDDSRKDIVYMLSCIRRWDDEMMSEIGFKIIPTFNLTTYEKVKGFSFVSQTDEKTYMIHYVIGTIMSHNAPDSIKKRTCEFAIEFCKEKIKSVGVFSDEYEYYLIWLNQYGITNFESDREIIDFFNKNVYSGFYELFRNGKYEVAHSLIEAVLAIAERDKSSELYAEFMQNLFDLYRAEGKYKQAFECAQISYDVFVSLYGIHNQTTLVAYSKLGSAYYSIGNYAQALKIKQEVYTERVTLLGEMNGATINVLDYIGDIYFGLGDYRKAHDIHKEVYEKFKQNYGEDNSNTITAMHSMAEDCRKLGDYQKALEYAQSVYEKRKSKYGEDDPSTLSAMWELSCEYNNVGNLEAAFELDKVVYEKRKKIYGDFHPMTLRAIQNLTYSYREFGKYDEALKLDLVGLEKYKLVYGDNHSSTLWQMMYLASSHRCLGHYNEALALNKEAYEKFLQLRGDLHPDTLWALNGLAGSYSKLKKYDEACEMYKTLYDKRKQLLGEEHPDTISSLNSIAWNRFSAGSAKEGLPYAEKLELFYKDHSEITPDVIIQLDTVAMVYADAERINDAAEIADRLIKLSLDNFPEDKKSLGTRYYTAAYVYEKLGVLNKALDYAIKSLNLRSEMNDKSKINEVHKLIEQIESKH